MLERQQIYTRETAGTAERQRPRLPGLSTVESPDSAHLSGPGPAQLHATQLVSHLCMKPWILDPKLQLALIGTEPDKAPVSSGE